MRTQRFALVLFIGLLALVSCSRHDPNAVRLISALPNGILSQSTVLQFAFSRGVVPPESTNIWMTSPFVEFQPAIEGKFSWQDTARLVFSPDGNLPGDTKFKGRINRALLVAAARASGYEGDDEFSFATEPFTLKGAEFFYDRIDNKRTVGIRANLEFTYTVNPADLEKFITVTLDGERVKNVKVASSVTAKTIPVELGIVVQYNKERKIKVDIDNELVSPETKTSLVLKKPFEYTLPSLEDLKIYGHEFGFDGTESWIRVKTSQEVDLTNIKSFLTISPARPFTVEPDARMAFRLKGKFEPGITFSLTVKKGLESILGATLNNDYEADIIIGNVKPSFRFAASTGTYMLMSGARSVDFKTVNLAELSVRVSEIFQNNLVHFLSEGRHYDYYYGDDEEEEGYHRKYRYYLGNNGRIISERKIQIGGAQNQEITTPFDLGPFIQKDYKGFYLIEIADPKESWRWTSKLVSISDIGLIVKRSAQELLTYAVSLNDNEPMSGVQINLISTNNQTMASLKTNGDGLARFADFRKLSEDFTLKLITAENGDDFNFINLEDYRVETSRYDVDGKREIEGMYDAFMYGDRNLYRPGEKIYVSGIIRNLTNGLPENMPVKIRIYNPREFKVDELQRTLNEQGSFEISYETSETAPTGEYRFELLTGNDGFLSAYRVSVEEFVPDRMRVVLTPSKPSARPGETVVYDLEAHNFFGPPATDRKTEFEATFEAVPYKSKRFPDFWFADEAVKAKTDQVITDEAQTDNEGKASFEVEVPKDVASGGILSMRGRVSVFDESGRPVNQIVRTTIFPKSYFIGLKSHIAYYVAPNSPLKVDMVAVDASDSPLDGFRANIEIIRREWHTVLRLDTKTNSLRYVSEQREVLEKSEERTLGKSPLEYVFEVARSGDYVVRVSKKGDAGYNQVDFYAYSWGATDLTSFGINPEARVEMVFDKAVYAPGEKAKVLFQAPFNGRMLVTVERNKVYSHRYLNVENNSASMEIPVEESYLPNVYVGAVLFRKVKDLNIPLMAGHGFAPLMVEKASNKLTVAIDAPEKIRPNRKQAVTVHIPEEKNVFVTLAAVDEGICQVKNYRTPDPYGFFYAKKSLQTETFDFFRDLIPESGQKKSSTGGGEAEQRELRVNPLSVKRFKPVALWSGILKTDGDGNARVTLTVPDISGELRLMALAYKKDRFGSAQKPMKVADPIVITPALPRFLSPNDVITMPITAFNTTDKPVSLKFEIITSGGISSAEQTAALDVSANQEKYVNVTLRASDQVGKATVKVRTKAFGETFESVTDLAVRPIAPYVTESIVGFADAGKTVVHDIPDVFLRFGRRAHIVLSPFPVANMAKQLKELVGYPHGCLEQTTSKAFPQIYLRDIALLLDPSILEHGSPSYFVNEAINKITGMQQGDGSFTYWPGGNYSDSWSTVYATHFLVEAKKAGYAVPEATLNGALNFIRSTARDKELFDYHFWDANRYVVRRIADKTAIYALYVLALAGHPDIALMNFYRTSKSLLTYDTEYLLAGAFALSGDRKAYLEILPPQFVTEEAQRTAGGWYDSPIRANAIILNVLLETDPDNPNIARYIEYLSNTYKKYYWYSTQDNAFTLVGFGKAARRAGGAKVRGSISIGGTQVAYNGGNKKIPIDQFGQKLTIALEGEGRAYYSIVMEGIRQDGKIKIEDKNLRIRREFFDRFGNAVNIENVRQNSLVVIKLTLQSDVENLENVAITDLLPAGFEIENPRLSENPQYEFTKNAATPVYVDIRDDRINYYTNFRYNNRAQTFYYLVRAVTKGEFNYAAVAAEAMYDGNYYSASGGGKVRVVE
jgi:uncharacterized protein YfaS (alpha-2-macroglobulin family)